MTSKKKPKRSGLAPKKDRLAEMHADGYYTPKEIAARLNLSPSAVHNWIQNGALEEVDGKPGEKKVGPNRWVLLAAAERRAGVAEVA